MTYSQLLIILLSALVLLLVLMLVIMHISAKQRTVRDRDELQRLRQSLSSHIPPRLKVLDDWKVEVHTAVRLSESVRPKRRGEERDEFDRKVFNQQLHCDKYEQFFSLVDKRLNGFATRVRNDFQLRDRELMFVCLSALDLSDEQIALIMEYSLSSIPTTRKRISTKLRMSNVSEWRRCLLDLINQD